MQPQPTMPRGMTATISPATKTVTTYDERGIATTVVMEGEGVYHHSWAKSYGRDLIARYMPARFGWDTDATFLARSVKYLDQFKAEVRRLEMHWLEVEAAGSFVPGHALSMARRYMHLAHELDNPVPGSWDWHLGRGRLPREEEF